MRVTSSYGVLSCSRLQSYLTGHRLDALFPSERADAR